MISDRDTIITVAGGSKKEYLDKQVGSLVESCMENRKTIMEATNGTYELSKDHDETLSSLLLRQLSLVVIPLEPLSCSTRMNP